MNAPLIREARLDELNAAEMVAEMAAEARRPVHLAASSFACWRLLDGGKAQRHPLQSETLPAIEREIATEAAHGATFLVRETATISGRAILHAYRVRRGKWGGRMADGRKVYPYAADPLFSVEVSAFDPVEPWCWTPGCDVTGRNAQLIEVRS